MEEHGYIAFSRGVKPKYVGSGTWSPPGMKWRQVNADTRKWLDDRCVSDHMPFELTFEEQVDLRLIGILEGSPSGYGT